MKNIHEKYILIIEDSVATANLLDEFLKELGYQNIHICNNGKAGIKKFLELSNSNRLPLVFLDYYLPDMHAISVFEELIETQPKTKIIIETVAEKKEEGIQYLTQHGAYHYLHKPFTFEDLKKVMNTFETEELMLKNNSSSNSNDT